MNLRGEIGSDFWKIEEKRDETCFLLSGRTALEYIIRDILAEKEIRRALLPSYCCHTMIEPFLRNGIEVCFYDVYFDGTALRFRIPEPEKKEIFLYIEYFGYQRSEEAMLRNIRLNWETVIEDRTHSWAVENRGKDIDADYRFISFRKWTGIGGIAAAEKRNGRFHIEKPLKRNRKFESLIETAQEKKRKYMEEGEGDKQTYLRMFGEAEKELSAHYLNCQPDKEATLRFFNIDRNKVRSIRRKNAEKLINELKSIWEINLLYETVEEGEVPLFVPILVRDGRRDALRKYLTEQKIYCPVHWPLSELHEISEEAKKLYCQELSLVCDQRYGEEDMERIVQSIISFLGR